MFDHVVFSPFFGYFSYLAKAYGTNGPKIYWQNNNPDIPMIKG